MEDAAKLRQSQSEAPLVLYFGRQLQSDTWSRVILSIGLFFLTLNAVLAVYRSLDDPPTIVLVVTVYVLLLLLLFCVHLLDGLPEGSVEKERLKIPVWLLSTLLNVIFAWRFSLVIPWPFAVFGWSLAVLTGVLGFYFLFIYKETEQPSEVTYDCEKLCTPVTKSSNKFTGS